MLQADRVLEERNKVFNTGKDADLVNEVRIAAHCFACAVLRDRTAALPVPFCTDTPVACRCQSTCRIFWTSMGTVTSTLRK